MAKKRKPVKNKATTSKPPVPDYYLTDLPPEAGRANIKIEFEEGKAAARVSVPAKHLNSLTGLTVGALATAAPVAAIAITCYAKLPVPAIIALTAMASVVALSALALLFYMLRNGDP
jgi:hypothetical protein